MSEWRPIETAPKEKPDGEDIWFLAIRAGSKIPFATTWDDEDLEFYTFNRAYERDLKRKWESAR